MNTLILVVDDDPALLRLAVLLLGANGFEVLTATNGREALRVARTHQPAAILLDMSIPESDGVAVLDAMRRDPALRRLPVVAMSGYFGDGHLPAQVERHCVGFLEKPLSLRGMLDEVGHAMAR